MWQKYKVKDILGIILACVVALAVGVLIALPIILKIELATSAINYMDRH